jgi:hypothetical protein
MLLDPGADRLGARSVDDPLDRLPGSRDEDAADDLLAVTVPLERARIEIPEECLHGRREGVGVPIRVASFSLA